MKISLSATNPCHMLPLARELHRQGKLGAYYSGYPQWKLRAPEGMPVVTHSIRTTIVYGLLKFAPARLRPSSRSMFLWQDHGFDRWVGRNLEDCDFIHAMPGQCLHTFRAAKRRGIRAVMNHATGPVREWVKIMEPEYARVGLKLTDVCPYDAAYFAREDEEYALADWHCAASTVVRDQLVGIGVSPDRIWVAPYGADVPFVPDNGAPPDSFRILFAGQVGLRKGIKALLDALALEAKPDWEAHFYGAMLDEARTDLDAYHGETKLQFHGPVGQSELAAAFRRSSVLVLPSLEEGFGLVVPQALAIGLPVIVSDRVGSKDLVRHRENGSIFPTGDAAALRQELEWWSAHPKRLNETVPWDAPTAALIRASEKALRQE